MPVPCHKKNGFLIGNSSSDHYNRTMYGSDPLLSKPNNNKTTEQNGRCANGIGYLDTGRRRCGSASSAVENGKVNGTTCTMNGHDSKCQEVCVHLAYDVVFSKVKDNDNLSGWLFKLRSNGVQIDNEYTRTMQRTVAEISDRHDILFTSMVKSLKIRRDNVQEVFTSVVDDILSDGQVNWGRVVTIYALEGKIAEYLAANEMDDCLEGLAEHVGRYVYDVIGDWIMENHGWDGFVQFFPDRTADNRAWNGLMWTAGLVGAGLATLFALKT